MKQDGEHNKRTLQVALHDQGAGVKILLTVVDARQQLSQEAARQHIANLHAIGPKAIVGTKHPRATVTKACAPLPDQYEIEIPG